MSWVFMYLERQHNAHLYVDFYNTRVILYIYSVRINSIFFNGLIRCNLNQKQNGGGGGGE